MNLHEISVLDENVCSKILKFLTCGLFKKNKKIINKKRKSFELNSKNQILSHIGPNNVPLNYSSHSNNEINNLQKRFISKYKTVFNDTYIFYSKLTSSVEISIKNVKIKKYFKIPFNFINLNEELKLKIINAWKSSIQNSSIREIFNNIEKIVQILNHKQKLRKYNLLFEYLKPLEIIGYLFTLIQNIILFIFTENNDVEKCSHSKRTSCLYINSSNNRIRYKFKNQYIYYIIISIIYIKLILYFILLILTILKRYKIIKHNMINKADILIEEYKENKLKKYEGSLLYHVLKELNKTAINSYNYILVSLYKSKLNIFFDFDIIALLINIIFSFMSIFISPFFQTINLFDIIRLNSFLNNVVFILMKEFNKIFFMVYVLLIIVFCFSFFEFMFMREYYYSNDYMNISDSEINLYCDTIYYCFISILHYGFNPNNLLFIGGSINRSKPIFFVKLVIDLLLFCFVFSLGFNVFLGVIINSLKEFNELMIDNQKSINEKCFICGIPRYKIDREEKGWTYHYKREHNIFSYIYFLSKLKNKNFYECDGVEKYVKKCIEKEKLSFLPLKK